METQAETETDRQSRRGRQTQQTDTQGDTQTQRHKDGDTEQDTARATTPASATCRPGGRGQITKQPGNHRLTDARAAIRRTTGCFHAFFARGCSLVTALERCARYDSQHRTRFDRGLCTETAPVMYQRCCPCSLQSSPSSCSELDVHFDRYQVSG